MFQLISVTVSTGREEARNKRKQFALGGKYLYTGTKPFPNKSFSTDFSEGFHL